MGGSVGAIGDGFKNIFSNAGDAVKGTGQSIGDLKGDGYSDADISTLGGGSPSAGVDVARRLAKGSLGGLGQGLQQQQRQRSQFYGGGFSGPQGFSSGGM